MKSYSLDYERREDGKYILHEAIVYTSPRYGKTVTCPVGMVSDGATGKVVPDISSRSWWVHDRLCDTGMWDDGTKVNNWQCSQVLQDILREEGDRARSTVWFWATWLCGGGKARKNGMW